MFSFIKYSKSKDENIFNIRFPLSEKDKVLKEKELQFKYKEKVYFLNNVVINVNPNGYFFNYENDISIKIDDNFIVREYKTSRCSKFNFYESDLEEEYNLYENEDSSIKLKEFDEYYTLEIISSNGLKI